MSRKKKRNIGAIVIIAAVLVVLGLTNPSSDDFSSYLQRESAASVRHEAGSGALGDLLGGVAQAGMSLVASTYVRTNLVVVSVFSQRGHNPQRYLGFGKLIFIKISNASR
jgi:hypothetical protein